MSEKHEKIQYELNMLEGKHKWLIESAQYRQEVLDEIASLKQQLSEAAKIEEEAFDAGRKTIGIPSYSAYTGVGVVYTYPAYADYLKTKKAEAIVNKNIEGFEYLADKEQK